MQIYNLLHGQKDENAPVLCVLCDIAFRLSFLYILLIYWFKLNWEPVSSTSAVMGFAILGGKWCVGPAASAGHFFPSFSPMVVWHHVRCISTETCSLQLHSKRRGWIATIPSRQYVKTTACAVDLQCVVCNLQSDLIPVVPQCGRPQLATGIWDILLVTTIINHPSCPCSLY